MREIKFKVWDIGKKVFIPEDVYTLTFNTDSPDFGVMIKDWENYKEGEYFYSNSQIAIQSTGLKDGKGFEIFEGDFVVYPNPDCKGDVRFGCYEAGEYDLYVNGTGFYINRENGYTQPIMQNNVKGITVIGNIYENPELIKH